MLSTSIRCRSCAKQRSCGSCFEPSTVAAERLPSGARSALCRVCFAVRQGQSIEEVPADIRVELEHAH